jgi:regulator of replication initiation timing
MPSSSRGVGEGGVLSAAILVALLLLPAIQADGPTRIPIYVTYAVGKTPVLVYADREGSSCPYPEDVDRILGEGLEAAFRNHLGAMMRFVGEFGPQYARLLELRFERTDNRDGASVVVVAKELEENVAGATYLTTHTPVVIELDCGLAKAKIQVRGDPARALSCAGHRPRRAGALHDELMGAPLHAPPPPPYPSSLDALALWELWFSGRTYRPGVEVMFTIPSGFPYVVLLPYDATIRELEAGKATLEQRYEGLYRMYEENTKQLYNMTQLVASLREDVRKLGAENEALRAENARLAGRVGELESLLAGRETALANLSRAAEDLRAALGEREGQVARLTARVAELQGRLERSEAWASALLATVLLMVPIAIIIPAAAIALGKRRDVRRQQRSRGSPAQPAEQP